MVDCLLMTGQAMHAGVSNIREMVLSICDVASRGGRFDVGLRGLQRLSAFA
jgi:hypothetical protein